MEADIIGQMQQPLDGWEERTRALAQPGLFTVEIGLSEKLREAITDKEFKRLDKKLRLVEEYAKVMCAGMMKGTIKYETDDYDPQKWLAHLIGEGADQSCYSVLLVEAVLPILEAATAAREKVKQKELGERGY